LLPPYEKIGIYESVSQECHEPEPDLQLARESGRIQYLHDVVIDEAPLIAGLSAELPKVYLQRRQGTDRSGEFDQYSPKNRGDVNHRSAGHRSVRTAPNTTNRTNARWVIRTRFAAR